MTDMKTLVGKLNPGCRKALEQAAQLCVKNTNFNVEIEHLLLCLLDGTDTDIAALLRYYEIDEAAVRRELSRAGWALGVQTRQTLMDYVRQQQQ